MTTESKTDPYRKRFTKLKGEFETNWRAHLKDISDYLMTRKGRFLDTDTTPNDGNKRNTLVYDGTGGRALRILAAGMQSGLTSPARPWFRLGLADKDLEEFAPVRAYLDEVRRRMLTVFSKSNFYSAVHSVYGELGGFGTSAMLIEEDFKHVIRCYPFTIGEYFIATDPSHRVDTLYRKFAMTAKNMVEKFGEKNVSDNVSRLVKENNQDSWQQVIHAIQPNTKRNPLRQDSKNMPWVSVYMEDVIEDTNQFLRESGYPMFPVMAPRWDTTGSEVYGRSPGMEVLPDVMMLQKLQADGLVALDQLVRPPMNAPPSLQNEAKSIISGGVTYVDTQAGQQGFTPTYQIRPDFKSMEYKIEKVQMAIKEGFYNDLFLMMALSGDKQMTAREVAERHEEKLLSVGPVVERLQPELFDRVIDRTYDIMEEAQMLPEPPQELMDRDIEVEYVGILAQAQKMVGMTAIEQTAGFVANLTATWPEARHKFDPMQAVDEYSRMAGTPVSVINSDEETKRRINLEGQAVQAQQDKLDADRTAQNVKTLSETDLDKNSVLKQITGSPA